MTEMQSIKLSEEEFEKSFSLVLNTIRPNAAYEGYAFETFGAELEFVGSQPANRVWSLIEEDGQLVLISGFHSGYVIYFLVSNEVIRCGIRYNLAWC